MPLAERGFVGALRLEVFLLSLAAAGLLAPVAGAALKKYGVARQNLLHYSNTSPQARFDTSSTPGSVALIDESSAQPVLRKLVVTTHQPGQTTETPALTNGFIFLTSNGTQGFEPSTGSGGSNTSIHWGSLDGWTISGTFFCHSVPSYICDLTSAQDSETTDPAYLSSHYDVGTWTFHGTGFTVNLGYINQTSTTPTGFGNLQHFLRGARVFDGTVPALSLLGVAAVGLSVASLTAASRWKRRGLTDRDPHRATATRLREEDP